MDFFLTIFSSQDRGPIDVGCNVQVQLDGFGNIESDQMLHGQIYLANVFLQVLLEEVGSLCCCAKVKLDEGVVGLDY